MQEWKRSILRLAEGEDLKIAGVEFRLRFEDESGTSVQLILRRHGEAWYLYRVLPSTRWFHIPSISAYEACHYRGESVPHDQCQRLKLVGHHGNWEVPLAQDIALVCEDEHDNVVKLTLHFEGSFHLVNNKRVLIGDYFLYHEQPETGWVYLPTEQETITFLNASRSYAMT